jgi:hypothetical protein
MCECWGHKDEMNKECGHTITVRYHVKYKVNLSLWLIGRTAPNVHKLSPRWREFVCFNTTPPPQGAPDELRIRD